MSDNNDFVSSVKLIPYAQDVVYDKLQDLRHLENLCSRLKDPAFVEQAKGQFDSSKVEEAIKRLESVRFTQDSLSVDSPVGAMTLAIVFFIITKGKSEAKLHRGRWGLGTLPQHRSNIFPFVLFICYTKS